MDPAALANNNWHHWTDITEYASTQDDRALDGESTYLRFGLSTLAQINACLACHRAS